MTRRRGAYGTRTHPSADPAYRRELYAKMRFEEGYKPRIQAIDYMPIAKERVANDPLRKWKRGPELWK